MKNKHTLFVSIVLMLILSVILCAAAPLELQESKTEAITAARASFSDLYEEINPSVVYIAVKVPADSHSSGGNQGLPFDFEEFFGPDNPYFDFQEEDDSETEQEPQYSYGSGTGFVWDEDGHIVTNNHVIEDAVEVTVTYYDGMVRDATVIGADPDSDLAVIEVEDFRSDIKPVTMGDSTQIKPGDLTAAIGNPFGNTGTMTQGIISALGRSYSVGENDGEGNYSIPDVIQTDASINPGNSGGVLLNIDGEVIGVVMAFSSASYSSAGIGYAIPSALVSRVIPKLISDGEYQHPWIGISGIALSPTVNEAIGLDHDMRGAFVQTIQKNSPAEAAGLIAGTEELDIEGASVNGGGDIITKIGDRDVKGMDDIIAYLSSHTSIGDTIVLHVLRDGEEIDVDLTLAARPNQQQRSASAEDLKTEKAAVGGAWLGIYGTDLSTEVLEAMELPEDTAGALVNSVTEDSPADDAGLIGCEESAKVGNRTIDYGGDIIQKVNEIEIGSMEELKEALADFYPGERVTLTVLRGGKIEEIRLTLGNTEAR